MADTIDSIATIPNPTDNFDETWLIVSRDGGKFVERMANRTRSVLCGGEQTFLVEDQIRVDSSITYDSPIDVSGVSLGASTTINASSHGLSDGDQVYITCIEGTTELNWNTYKVIEAETNFFGITDTSDNEIDSSGYTTYVSGGFVREKVSSFSGLDHLEGEIVSILGDGTSVTASTVSGGSVNTSSAYGLVHIGLPYFSDLETLDIEIGLQNGTIQGRKVNVGNIMYRFVESRGGWIGPDSDNLYEAFTDLLVSRNATELTFSPSYYTFVGQDIDNPDPYLYTGDLRRSLKSGHSRGGRSFFRQVSPYAVNVSAVIPEIEIGNAT